MGIVQIGLQIRARHPRIRVYANLGNFGCIISPKNNQLAFFRPPVRILMIDNSFRRELQLEKNTNKDFIKWVKT